MKYLCSFSNIMEKSVKCIVTTLLLIHNILKKVVSFKITFKYSFVIIDNIQFTE